MPPIYGAGGVLFNSAGDRVLLVRENESNGPTGRVAGQLSIPMGHAHEGEESRKTAEREFQEETGSMAEAADFIGVFKIPNTEAVLHAYLMRSYTGLLARGELVPRFVPVRDLLSLEQEAQLRAPTRQVVEAALRMLSSASAQQRPP